MPELDFVQPAVQIAAAQQFVMRADVGDQPLVHHDDPVGQGQRGQAVGDDNRRPIPGEDFQHPVDQLLALQIDLAGGLIQDQDRGIAEDRPGQGNSLPLTAGKHPSLAADTRVVAMLQPRLDELVGVSLFGRFDDVLAIALGAP